MIGTELLTHPVTFKRWTPGNPALDVRGNEVATFDPDNAATLGFMQPGVKTELRDGQEVVVAQWVAFFNPGINVPNERDRATWGARTLKIVSVTQEEGPQATAHYEIAFMEIEGGPS